MPNGSVPKNLGGNIASPEQNLQAAVEWTTEDFLSAEPYPIPEITEEMVSDFVEKMTAPRLSGSSRCGSCSAGPIGTSMAILAVYSRIWVLRS